MSLIIEAFLLIFLIQVAFFAIAATFKTDKVTDLSYGLTFIIAALLLLPLESVSLVNSIVAVMVVLWGIRLSTYLFIRILKMGRDKRFDGIREQFLKFASFWSIQAVTIWILLLPLLFIYNNKTVSEPVTLIASLGILVWFVGLIIESLADSQKYRFKLDSANKDKWIQSGLWNYSRHPNYFGEILCWWGIFIFSLSYISGFQYIAIASPIFITIILLYFSGIPTLEKKYETKYKDDEEYQAYKARTSMLILLPHKIN